MNDEHKTREQLVVELAELKASASAERKRMENLIRTQRDLAVKLGEASQFDEVLNLCLDTAIHVAGMDSGGIYLVDDVSGDIDLVCHVGLGQEFISLGLHYDADSEHARLVMAGNPNYTSSPVLDTLLTDLQRSEGLRTLVVLPVLHQGRVIACINVASHILDEVRPTVRDALETMAAQVGSVTARAKAQRALHESEEKFRNIIQSSPMGIHMYELESDERLVFVGANPAADRLLGVNNEQFIGKTIEQAFPPLIETPIPRMYRRAAREGVPWNTEQINYQDQQITGAFEVHAFQTSPNKMAALFLDITERKRADEELERHRERLEELVVERTQELKDAQAELMRKERLSALGQLTATVAHEIRNPLGTVRTAVFAIGDAIERDEIRRVGRVLELAERNIVRCDGIIRELLDYTRDRSLQFKPTRVDAWLDAVLDEQDIPKEIVCTRQLTFGGEIPMDGEYLRRAVINVVENAIDALQDERAPGNRLTVSTRATGSRLEIQVGDTGCGIPAGVLLKIFEPLFSTKTFGVGLGLPVVHKIMQQHGGGVEIESEVGQGCTATLWLPMPDK